MFDWIPNLHPIIVHFPIALLIAGLVADAGIFLLRGTSDAPSTWLYAGGTAALIAAFFSGRAAVDSLLIPADAQAIQTDHADWALVTLLFFIAFTLVRTILLRLRKPGKNLVRAISVAGGIVGAVLLSITGDLGGRMVFGHGVGVTRTSGSESETVENRDLEAIGPGSVLGHTFRAVSGRLSDAVLAPDSTILTLFVDREELVFVTDDVYGSVEAEMELNLDRFRGRASLLYGYVSEDRTDYIEFDQGTVEQGRRSEGGSESFDTAVMTPDGWFTLTAVSDAAHFRGYVDGSVVVHGHGDPAAEGSVGLKLDGSGVVQIRRLTIERLR